MVMCVSMASLVSELLILHLQIQHASYCQCPVHDCTEIFPLAASLITHQCLVQLCITTRRS